MKNNINNYPGSKKGNGAFQIIINQIPPIDIFIDAFAGSGVISDKFTSAAVIVKNDIDPYVTSQYKPNPAGNIVNSNMDYRSCIANYAAADKGVLIYCDPPYLFSSRSYQKRLYSIEWGAVDHIAFIAYVCSRKEMFIVSHYPCPTYDDALSHWRKITYQSMTRTGVRTEALYLNYPEPQALATYDYFGDSFTQRQQLLRKKNRILQKFKSMSPIQRNYIMHHLNKLPCH